MMARKKRKNKQYYRVSAFLSLVAVAVGTVSFLLSQIGILPLRAQNADEEQTVSIEESVVIEEAAVEAAQDTPWELATLVEARPEQIIEHLAYTVSFNPKWNIPNWVAYSLTEEETIGDLGRSDHFLPDPLVESDPVVTRDYSNSGYDRGHMAPAADMKWSEQAMRECFYMTNMCPQNHSNNAGDWKDLEELGRDLACKYKQIYICCGPIVTDASVTIGNERKIVVPQLFYKAFLRRKSNGDWISIAFVMPNAAGNKPLLTYVHTVDEVEQLTGIDLFYQLPDSIEAVVESDYTVADWTVK